MDRWKAERITASDSQRQHPLARISTDSCRFSHERCDVWALAGMSAGQGRARGAVHVASPQPQVTRTEAGRPPIGSKRVAEIVGDGRPGCVGAGFVGSAAALVVGAQVSSARGHCGRPKRPHPSRLRRAADHARRLPRACSATPHRIPHSAARVQGSGWLHRTSPRCTESSRFVTVAVVTVAGKGGRPKKWKSDADRVRAYRARQRGEAEPATLEQAVEPGDEFADHVARIAELEVKVASGRRAASQLTARVRQLDRENGEMQGQLERMERELDTLRELNARLTQQRDQLRAALNAWAELAGGVPDGDVAVQLSRAERRRRAREELRRRPL